jgi:predicted TIM-barrel fold metal-dependent hydrolase
MAADDRNSGITRRRFLEGSVSATAEVLAVGAPVPVAPLSKAQSTLESDPAPAGVKIALEEHFVIPETLDASSAAAGSSDFQQQIAEIGSRRIAEMDRGGVELCILSLTAPGIQGIVGTSDAIKVARRANDRLAEAIVKYPKRLKGFAALPIEDPQAAAQELTRCVKELKSCGALVNAILAVR